MSAETTAWPPECRTCGSRLTDYQIKSHRKANQQMKLGGRDRWLQPGETALVPKRAVTHA